MRRHVLLVHTSPFSPALSGSGSQVGEEGSTLSAREAGSPGAPDGSSLAARACETDAVKTRNLIIAAVITGTLILGAFVLQFATDRRFLGG